MANIESIKTDLNKEENGVWVTFVSGIELLIARARNPKYNELMRRLADPVINKIRDEDKFSSEDYAKLLMEVRAKTILLGWKNIQDKNGNDIKYSSEKALEFFKDPELKDFYAFIVGVSESADHFKKLILKASEKN
jgi:hypothetical protein